MKSIEQYIKEYQQKGFSFFNTSSNEKKILTQWHKYQNQKPTEQDISIWLNKYRTQNYAIVCGKISNLIVFDIDIKNGADPTPFQNLGMYEVKTPSGGYHFYCKYNPLLKSIAGKTRTGILKGVDIQSDGKVVFAPPSKFSNGEYQVLNDCEIGEIPDELLIKVLDELEPEREEKADYKPYKPQPYHFTGDAKPGDIYNALATWAEVLIPFGWTPIGPIRQNGIQYWRRPGKKDGVSASTNWNNYDLLIPFTTSTVLEQFKGYTKFGALTALQYNGDYKECSRQLVMRNSKLAIKNLLKQ